jgi:hypothetical protein
MASAGLAAAVVVGYFLIVCGVALQVGLPAGLIVAGVLLSAFALYVNLPD